MRRLICLVTIILVSFKSISQVRNPVNWSFSSKKIVDNTYEVHLTATIQNGWHIYSQTTPDGGPVPTKFSFTKNPLLTMDDAVKETGKLEQHHEPLFDVDVKQFSNRVDFVQVVKIKGNAKTSVAGSVEFMVCNDSECLPPKSENFSISLK